MDMVNIATYFILVIEILSCCAENLLAMTQAPPEFIPGPFNVSYHVGDFAKLPCSIKNLGTKTVVWRRYENSFPLTSGKLTVIDDKRIQVSHVAKHNHWDLMIKDVKLDDEGVYECQISTKDRTVRRLVTLNVIEPKVELPEITITEPQYVERGDVILLQCNATGNHYAPEEIDWFRNGQKIASVSRKGINISKQLSIYKKKFTSVLKIDRAEMEDDGTYVCRTSNSQITSTKVIVLNAETSPIKRGTAGDKQSDNKESYTSRSTAMSSPRTFLYSIVSSLVVFILNRTHLFPS